MKKVYHPSLDFLRIISILAVVLIHTSTRTLEISHYDLKNLALTLFFNQFARFAVPLFFIISGFALTISNHDISYKSFLKKRLSKVLVPYILWSIFYFLVVYKDSDNLITALLTGSASYQLYFIPSLLIFYFLFPALLKLYPLFKNKVLILALFLIEIFILNYDYQHHSSHFPFPISVALFNFFPFTLGIYLAKNQKSINNLTKKLWPIFAMISLTLAFFIFNEGLTNYYKTYNYNFFYSSWRPSILIYTIFIFLTLYHIGNQITSNYFNFIKTLSRDSFFVFFVHIIILEIVYKFSYKSDLLFFFTVSVISFLVAFISNQIKSGRPSPLLVKLPLFIKNSN